VRSFRAIALGGGAKAAYGIGMTDRAKQGSISGTPRATRRPAHVKAPAGWTATPVPAPAAAAPAPAESQPGGRDPVRYGDWEYKGLAIDF
jgi:hypothetical protein